MIACSSSPTELQSFQPILFEPVPVHIFIGTCTCKVYACTCVYERYRYVYIHIVFHIYIHGAKSWLRVVCTLQHFSDEVLSFPRHHTFFD